LNPIRRAAVCHALPVLRRGGWRAPDRNLQLVYASPCFGAGRQQAREVAPWNPGSVPAVDLVRALDPRQSRASGAAPTVFSAKQGPGSARCCWNSSSSSLLSRLAIAFLMVQTSQFVSAFRGVAVGVSKRHSKIRWREWFRQRPGPEVWREDRVDKHRRDATWDASRRPQNSWQVYILAPSCRPSRDAASASSRSNLETNSR
jgi:hypothetical protein